MKTKRPIEGLGPGEKILNTCYDEPPVSLAQMRVLRQLFVEFSPREWFYISSLDGQYKTFETLAVKKLIQFNSRNRKTGKFSRARITRFGGQIYRMYLALSLIRNGISKEIKIK